MSRDTELNTLRGMLGLPEEKVVEPTPFAKKVAAVLTRAVISMREAGTIEVEDANLEGLTQEVIDAALESSSVKRLAPRISKTLIHSELVEEVYGTDEEIGSALRPFLEEL